MLRPAPARTRPSDSRRRAARMIALAALPLLVGAALGLPATTPTSAPAQALASGGTATGSARSAWGDHGEKGCTWACWG